MNYKIKFSQKMSSRNYLHQDDNNLSNVRKKEKYLSITIYLLVILLTMALMLILFKVVEL